MEKLDWLPLYIDDLLSSPAWTDMKDYQRGWYLQLLLRCTRSERLGYLKVDGNLWRIAGAHSQPMWEQHNGVVMACFKIRHDDGTQWLYNNRLLAVMEDQSQKYLRRVGGRTSPSSSLGFLRKEITKTGEEVSSTTPDLPAPALAKGMLEIIGLPVTQGNLFAVKAAIEAVERIWGTGDAKAFDWLMERVTVAKERGEEITKFWFEDAKYRETGGAKRVSKREQEFAAARERSRTDD